MNRRTVAINSALGAAAILLAGGTYATVTATARPASTVSSRTVAASRASVQATATASGSVSSTTTTAVGAGNCSGPVTSVKVSVGQAVKAGQELVDIDPTNAQNAVDSAQAQLDAAGAQANQSAAQAANSVAQAQQALTNARQTQGLDAQQQANAVATAQKQVDADQTTVNQAQATASANPNSTQDANALNSAQAQLAKDQQALTQAQNQQQSTALKDQQQISSAQVSLNSAANSQANSATGNTTTAQIALQTAQKNLADCVVKAPSDGTVTAIGAVVGATAGSSSGATSSSSSTGGSGGTGAAAASGGSSSSSSSSGLVTLTDTAHLQVVAGFSESDVATMKVGQTATFTFPAIKPDANAAPVTGAVIAIAATSTTTSGVVTYAVTVSIANPPAAVRLGESANISVTTATADNALIVPSLAITTAGNRQTVTVERNGAEQTVAVTTGITANGRTQVLTGLNDGDQVVLPSVTTSTDTGTTGTQGGRGIFGGGGGGGFGGGGTGGNANTGTGR